MSEPQSNKAAPFKPVSTLCGKALRHHQCTAARLLALSPPGHRGMLVYYKTGTGKTLTALAVATDLFNLRTIQHVIVVCPASVIGQFKGIIEKCDGFPKDLTFEVVSHFGVVNKFGKWMVWKEKELKNKRTLVIVDEVHKLANMRTDVRNKVTELCNHDQVSKLLLMTATPVVNTLDDFASIITLLRPELNIPASDLNTKKEQDALDRATKQSKDAARIELNQKERSIIDILRELARGYVCYYDNTMGTDQDDAKHFPAFSEKCLEMDLFGEQIMNIDALKVSDNKWRKTESTRTEEEIDEYEDRLYAKSRLISTASITENRDTGDYDSPKIDKLVEIVAESIEFQKQNNFKDSKLPAIVFCNFIEHGVNLIVDRLKRKFGPELEVCKIVGDVDVNKRKRRVDMFNNGQVDVIVMSAAGNTGLDFHGARSVHLISAGWTRVEYEQSIGRAIRYKSHEHLPEDQRDVTIYRYLHRYADQYSRIAVDQKMFKAEKTKDLFATQLLNIAKHATVAVPHVACDSALIADKYERFFEESPIVTNYKLLARSAGRRHRRRGTRNDKNNDWSEFRPIDVLKLKSREDGQEHLDTRPISLDDVGVFSGTLVKTCLEHTGLLIPSML